MTESELAKFTLSEVEKVRTRLHITENTVASMSHAMITTSNNLSGLLELQREQAKEIKEMKDDYIYRRNIKSFFEKKTTWAGAFIIFVILYSPEAVKAWQLVKGFIP